MKAILITALALFASCTACGPVEFTQDARQVHEEREQIQRAVRDIDAMLNQVHQTLIVAMMELHENTMLISDMTSTGDYDVLDSLDIVEKLMILQCGGLCTIKTTHYTLDCDGAEVFEQCRMLLNNGRYTGQPLAL